PWWVTFKQARDLGGHVRKGEKASLVTFWKFDGRQHGDGAVIAAADRRPPLLKHYWVFNAAQCEGLPLPEEGEYTVGASEPLPLCRHLVETMPQPPRIEHGHRQAFYCPTRDLVALPDLPRFESPEAFHATQFHELVHSTGHPSRLDRGLGAEIAPFGSPDYSREELVAEIGAGYLCGLAGIWPAVTENSAAYVAGWLQVLRGDKRLIITAAGQAQRAVDFIVGTAGANSGADE
ncbi:MAG: ArdC family protein, partial [Actinomycetota bacterium]